MTTLRLHAQGPDVERLQRALAALIYPVAIDGDFGPRTLDAVLAFQRSAGLTADGVVGPATWRALELAVPAEMPAPADESALVVAGEIAAAEALRLWDLDVFDPPIGSRAPRAAECLAIIEGIIQRAGWDWATPYRGNGPPQWCGLFAADCWRAAGLDPSWLATYWASTYRLALWGRYKRFSATSKANPAPPAGTPRRVYVDLQKPLTITPLAGDVVIVGDGEPDEGDHVTIAIGWDPVRRVFDTVSGNGGGVGPRGDRREGISRRDYAIDGGGYRAMWLVKPAAADLR